jgi:hypothetical protein
VSFSQQPLGQVTADETSASGDDAFHCIDYTALQMICYSVDGIGYVKGIIKIEWE